MVAAGTPFTTFRLPPPIFLETAASHPEVFWPHWLVRFFQQQRH